MTKKEAKKIASAYPSEVLTLEQWGPSDDEMSVGMTSKEEILRYIEQAKQIEEYNPASGCDPYDFILHMGSSYLTVNFRVN